MPSSHGMEQLLSSSFGDVVDGSLSQTILEVCVYAAICESLLPGGAVVDEGVVGKLAAVCMVVLNFYTVVGGELFKS